MAKKEKETNKKEVVFITQELKQKSTANEEYAKVKGFIFFVVIILVCVGLLAYINGNFVTKDYNEEESKDSYKRIFDVDNSVSSIPNQTENNLDSSIDISIF